MVKKVVTLHLDTQWKYLESNYLHEELDNLRMFAILQLYILIDLSSHTVKAVVSLPMKADLYWSSQLYS